MGIQRVRSGRARWTKKNRRRQKKSAATWSWWPDSNRRPTDYESVALPAELHQHGILAGIDDTTLSAQRQHQFAARPSDCRHGMRSIPVYYALYICTISCIFQPGSFSWLRRFRCRQIKNADFSSYFSGKTENYFPVYSTYFNRFFLYLLYIKEYVTFFYNKLFTFSTLFSTFKYPLFLSTLVEISMF